MRRFLAARVGSSAACWLFVLVMLIRPAGAQTWNDPRSRALIDVALQRRAEQLADTALRDYQASAHGYVTFLAQLGEGFRTPPKVLKADELDLEVYWHAPNLSKQRIVGRRDTLLLPTDIAYHRDHLGIVQNNFPDVIRIGEGDEVADVPHPLSRRGLLEYDFALTDSFAIGAGPQRIRVYEVKVRPKDDRQPRVVGAIYLDAAGGQVVRMSLSFTLSAFLDKALEELAVVLENRLVGGRFWLPSRQEVEIKRKGEWLDYPARGIIRGRWEIRSYLINQSLPVALFVGEEYTIAPPEVLAAHQWKGAILDSLPPDVRAISDPDIQRVQAEARQLVRARALASAQRATLMARNISDVAHFNRVEGLALGGGVGKQFAGGVSVSARARYGIDDRMAKGSVELARLRPDGSAFRLFAARDFRDLGDVAERSSVVNTLAAQEFGSDYTDPYLVRALGARVDFAAVRGFDTKVTASYEWQAPLGIHATPVTGRFEPTVAVDDRHATRVAIEINRAPGLWLWDTELTMRGEGRVWKPYDPAGLVGYRRYALRGALSAGIERPIGAYRLVTSASVAAAHLYSGEGAVFPLPESERVYLGGPVSAPGYDYHYFVSDFGYTAHAEWRMPVPFPSFSLGRYGRVPARATFAPFAHVAGIGDPLVCRVPSSGGLGGRFSCDAPGAGAHPSFGAAFILPFDLVRLDVARGTGRSGRWTFYVDVSREFWSIL